MKTATEVVAALIWDQDKFMICQRPAHKARGLLWEFVGGKVEPGETKEWSDTIKPYTQGDIMKSRKGVVDGTEIYGRL